MREIININDNWVFTKDEFSTKVTLPHTWNNRDGQGENDGITYDRCKCIYQRNIQPIKEGKVMLEFEGANSVCEVSVDGDKLGMHRGGYSHFRFDITPYARLGCTITAEVDNSNIADVYPAVADFTFYGGIYRNVNLIVTGDCRFSSRDYSSDGLYVTPFNDGNEWYLGIKSFIDNPVDGAKIVYTLLDKDGKEFCKAESDINKDTTYIKVGKPILWNGRKNPYLYTLRAEIILADGTVSDNLDVKTGFRTFTIDPQKGAFLNGEHIKLKGLCRHQDREDIGNALTPKEHEEDIEIIYETGCNALRLAHYQQDRYFYDLCDEKGILVWAEIPMISRFSAKKHQNAKMQLLELIKQNYNHPSIYCWGIANEITIGGNNSKLESCLRELNDIAKATDSTRYTTMAQLTMLPVDSSLNNITDIIGYNHYYGWYMDSCDGIAKWLDKFYAQNPDKCMCLSEYGAEAVLKWQTETPVQGDYTEQYQCAFHERYLEEINKRDAIYGSFLWNTFDFGSAIRSEGGSKGRNNKGLVTFDRKIKKDAFYLYKANWSDEPMVYICGRRYINRPLGVTAVKVYSNQPEVTLTIGDQTATAKSDNHIFVFILNLTEGETKITATAGKVSDSITVMGVTEPDSSYVLPEDMHSFVRNWFNDGNENDDSHFTFEDSLGDLLQSDDVKSIVHTQIGDKLDFVINPISKPLKKVKIGSAISAAQKVGLKDDYVDLAKGFFRTIKKK